MSNEKMAIGRLRLAQNRQLKVRIPAVIRFFSTGLLQPLRLASLFFSCAAP
jgi:hypothetical protein